MAEQHITRLGLRFNPRASQVDALIVAKLAELPVSPNVFIKNLLVNYFAGQDGGIGLDKTELEAMAKLYPKSAKKNSTERRGSSPESGGTVKHREKKVAAVVADEGGPSGIPGPANNAGWGNGSLPPCLDTSDL